MGRYFSELFFGFHQIYYIFLFVVYKNSGHIIAKPEYLFDFMSFSSFLVLRMFTEYSEFAFGSLMAYRFLISVYTNVKL